VWLRASCHRSVGEIRCPTIRPVAIYPRVSTHDHTYEHQLLELRRYAEARGWDVVWYADHVVSGSGFNSKNGRRAHMVQLLDSLLSTDSKESACARPIVVIRCKNLRFV